MDDLVWAEQEIRELKERVEKLEAKLGQGVVAPEPSNPLYEYFHGNWTFGSHPVIDFALHVNRNLDGTYHIYIHPQHVSGKALDFTVTPTETRLRRG